MCVRVRERDRVWETEKERTVHVNSSAMTTNQSEKANGSAHDMNTCRVCVSVSV